MNRDAKKHILFVDDDPQILSSIQRFWSYAQEEQQTLAQIQIHFAEKPSKALKLLQQHPIGLVVSDEELGAYELPGHMLLKHTATLRPLAQRCLLSGYGSYPELKALAYTQGVVHILTKPISPKLLISRITGLLNLVPY
ncbi:MAG: response regulator [Vampirovibrionales bacterium]